MISLTEGFTKEYLQRLEGLQLEVKRKMNHTGYNGIRKSNAKGSSIEFSDYRNYTTGDDLRRIDWNGYARFDRLFMKLFMEEKQALINLYIDCSHSMEGEKFWYSKMLTASLVYLSLKNMDRVNLFVCGKTLLHHKRNIQSKNLFLETIQFLEDIKADGSTNLTASISESAKMYTGAGVSIVFSDFFTEDKYENIIKKLQYAKQEVILVQVLSVEEISPQFYGPLRLVDSETGETKDIEITAQLLKQYQEQLKQYQNQLRESAKKRGVHFVTISTDVPLLNTLNRLL